ncbi:hypothetical protein HDU92_008075, partial [Lobulomyces angularis]
ATRCDVTNKIVETCNIQENAFVASPCNNDQICENGTCICNKVGTKCIDSDNQATCYSGVSSWEPVKCKSGEKCTGDHEGYGGKCSCNEDLCAADQIRYCSSGHLSDPVSCSPFLKCSTSYDGDKCRCNPGQTRCENGVQYTCNVSGLSWTPSACGYGETCIGNDALTGVGGSCKCSNDICDANGKLVKCDNGKFNSARSCDAGFSCSSPSVGNSFCKCDPVGSRCPINELNPLTVQKCVSGGTSWTSTACPVGEVCTGGDLYGNGGACKCIADQCNGNGLLRKCVNGVFSDPEPCPNALTGNSCTGGNNADIPGTCVCNPSSCPANKSKCDSLSGYCKCTSTLLTDSCGDGYKCDSTSGYCSCSPKGSTKCAGNDVLTCSDLSQDWVRTPCGEGQICDKGKCTNCIDNPRPACTSVEYPEGSDASKRLFENPALFPYGLYWCDHASGVHYHCAPDGAKFGLFGAVKNSQGIYGPGWTPINCAATTFCHAQAAQLLSKTQKSYFTTKLCDYAANLNIKYTEDGSCVDKIFDYEPFCKAQDPPLTFCPYVQPTVKSPGEEMPIAKKK